MYNYTVLLQSKLHRPLKFKTKAKNLSDALQRLTKVIPESYHLKAIIRKPQ